PSSPHAPSVTAGIDTLSLHDALPILPAGDWAGGDRGIAADPARVEEFRDGVAQALAYAGELGVRHLNCLAGLGGTVGKDAQWQTDRKSTRLNSSHVKISYAVFCLKKK